MKWSDYDFPERFQDRAAALGTRIGAYSNSDGSDDFDEWVEVRLSSRPDRVCEVRVSTQTNLGVVAVWGEAGFQGDAPRFAVRPVIVPASGDERLWRQRVGNYLVEQVRAL